MEHMEESIRIPVGPDGLIDMDTWLASFDRLYRRTDRLYYEISRECGLPESAYWVMYDIYVAGGQVPVRDIVAMSCASKQTINSAIRHLEGKGLARTEFCEGSRKAKLVCLTEDGRAFARERIEPACQAERRAFGALSGSEQAEMLRLMGKYVEAVEAELDRIGKGDEGE